MSKFHGAKSGYEAGKQFLKNLLKGGKSSDSGKAIKNIGTNVPVTELDKLSRDVKILDQKAKATKALVDQTNFEIKYPTFSKGRFTFDPNRKNVTKKSVKKRNEESKKIFKKSEGKAKGGRVGLKRGSFPDYSGDGEITKKDILIAKGVIPKPKGKKKKIESPMAKAVKKKNKKRFV